MDFAVSAGLAIQDSLLIRAKWMDSAISLALGNDGSVLSVFYGHSQ
jgi:hypothetical protein